MNNNNNDTDKTQELPLVISDVVWERFSPFLRAHTSVYVGHVEDLPKVSLRCSVGSERRSFFVCDS